MGVTGVLLPGASPRSVGPAQALKTTSRRLGVNKDKVRWESVSAASRRRFFWEKSECVSVVESSDNDAICDASSGLPERSTGSLGVLASGLVTGSSVVGLSLWRARSSSSRIWYSGTHKRSDNLWMIAGTSSIRSVRS